jgi:hypothetical protein
MDSSVWDTRDESSGEGYACYTRFEGCLVFEFYRFRSAAPVANDIGVCSAHSS